MSATTTFQVPQDEGELTPREAAAWQDAQVNEANQAGTEDKAAQALKLVTGVMIEREQKMYGLQRRWRGIDYMLSGNTLEKGGPEDVHMPEIYKAAETLVPRVEEQILGQQPWFRVIPKQRASRALADANEAFIDWQFSQAKVANLIQPAIRDALFTQTAIFYAAWHVEEKRVADREILRDEKTGKRTVKVTKKKRVTYFGPKVELVDPYDFIIDTKALDPQAATFVGHRAYLTIDQIRAIGKQRGWQNLDEIDQNDGKAGGTITSTSDYYKWPRDPAARYQTRESETEPSPDGRPGKKEVVFLYSKASFDEGDSYDDYLIVVVGGKTVVELRVNPLDGQYRPYAVIRSSKSGHEFYSTGTFDNAVRINQHLDAYHQTFLAGAKLAGCPMGFAEEDSDLPDTLYKIRPGQILKGVGAVRFTQVPDGFLRAAPLVIGMMQKNIEETVGAFRINMGQDTGGTATEASLSLQEGNRRTRGLIRAVGDGLEQLLHIFHNLNKQFSVEDVEFPVLGKRALSMRKTHLNISPADLLDNVEFELVGLRSSRTYGLKATGFQTLMNSAAPLMLANAANVDSLAMLHDMASELIGPEEADRYIKIPTPIDQIRSQIEENEALLNGADIDVDPEDDDREHIADMQNVYRRALDPKSKMPTYVRMAVIKHRDAHVEQLEKKKSQQNVLDRRAQAQQAMAPPQAGGQASGESEKQSPPAGGLSNAMEDLSTGPPGQSPMENPGPPDTRKGGRVGRRNQTISQSENSL